MKRTLLVLLFSGFMFPAPAKMLPPAPKYIMYNNQVYIHIDEVRSMVEQSNATFTRAMQRARSEARRLENTTTKPYR